MPVYFTNPIGGNVGCGGVAEFARWTENIKHFYMVTRDVTGEQYNTNSSLNKIRNETQSVDSRGGTS